MQQRLGAYDLLSELGRGAMGVVYRARHRPTGAERAVKVIEADARDPETLERFRREATALARVGGHANIVRVHETGWEGPHAYFAMEYVPGSSLAARIAHGPLEPCEAVIVVAKLARALGHCHAHGLIHRDVKPQNVLVDQAGEPRLVDFGLVRDLAAIRLTRTGTFIGTPAYMAPEQIRGDPAAPSMDVYALGVLLYEALSGERPHAAKTVVELASEVTAGKYTPLDARRPDLPGRLVALVHRTLSPDPAMRPASSQELALELEAIARAMKTGPVVAAGTIRRGRRVLAALVAVALALAVAVSAAAFARRPGAGSPPEPVAAAPAGPSDEAKLLRARAHVAHGEREAALADLEGVATAEALRLRTDLLIELERWRDLLALPATEADRKLACARVWARFLEDGDRRQALSELRKLEGTQTDFYGALLGREALDGIAAVCSKAKDEIDISTMVAHRPDALYAPLERAAATLSEASKHPRYLDRSAALAALAAALQLIEISPKEFYSCGDDSSQREPRQSLTAELVRRLEELAEQLAGGEEAIEARPHQVFAYESLLRLAALAPDRDRDERRLARLLASAGKVPPAADRRLRLLLIDRLGRDFRRGRASLEAACDLVESAEAAFPDADDRPDGYNTRAGLLCQAAVLRMRLAGESPAPAGHVERAERHLAKVRGLAMTPWQRRELAQAEFLLAFDRGDLEAAEKAAGGFMLSADDDVAMSFEYLLAGELRRRQGRSSDAERLLEAAARLAEIEEKLGRHGPFGPGYDCSLAYWLAVAQDPARRPAAREELRLLHAARASRPHAFAWIAADVEAAVR